VRLSRVYFTSTDGELLEEVSRLDWWYCILQSSVFKQYLPLLSLLKAFPAIGLKVCVLEGGSIDDILHEDQFVRWGGSDDGLDPADEEELAEFGQELGDGG
jgi:hypothetical protein